jgi:DNA-directed RNA polymerase specialized sigma24 family protein
VQRLLEAEQLPSLLTREWVVPSTPQHLPKASSPTTETAQSLPEETNCTQSEPKYPTGFGEFTFAELYHTTCRIVGYTLRSKMGMTNPEDIDDCMQSGYLKVWEQLQKQPDLFAGKPKKYIVQAVVLRSKAQRYAHLRHYRKIVYDADAQNHQHAGDLTTPQVETWVDLAQAIQRVAEYASALRNPIYLLALYSLITDVKTQDVAQTYQHGLSTLTAAKRQIRATLAKELPGYSSVESGVEPLALPKIRSFQSTQLHKQLISPLLLDDSTPYPSLPKPRTDVSLRRFPLPSSQEILAPVPLTPEVTYETRWRGEAIFEDLLSDPQVRKVAFAKMRSLGYTDEDAEDCFQLGTIKLWQALREQPSLLSDKGAAWVGVWIAQAGSVRSLWKHKARSVPLTDPDVYGNRRLERWASWATRVDQRIDFALLMNALAQRYDGDSIKLFALYSLTTSVKMKDVQAAAHAHKNQLIEARNKVKYDIREFLELDEDIDPADEYWTGQLQRGESLECVTRVAERVMDNQRLLLALYIVTTSATRKAVTELFNIPLTKFRQDIAQIKAMLAEECRKVSYGKSKVTPVTSLPPLKHHTTLSIH